MADKEDYTGDTYRWSITDIKHANREAGKYFFSRDTMRFFNSCVSRKVHIGVGGVFIVTSERFDEESPRLYTVCSFNPETGDVRLSGEFQAYATELDAHLAAKIASRTPRGEGLE
jgi:hypothetical protein